LSNKVFKPKNFYDFAFHIKNRLLNIIPYELKEAADRTCISRIYYAVFLSFRDKILALPIRNAEIKRHIERTNQAHAIIAETIRIVDAEIGDFLVNLRKLRNDADYKTDIVLSPDEVDYAFKIADEIFIKLAMMVNKIKEPDIISAWNNIQRKRQKERI
jgi:hypothetical protein